MQGRRVRDATSKERHVAHAGETVSRQVLKNRRRSLLHPPTPSAPRRAFPREYVEDFSAPRTTQMPVHRLSQ